MKNTLLNNEAEQDEDSGISETIGVGLQSILDSRSKQINKGLVNLTGNVVGNGNGSVHLTVHNIRNFYEHSQSIARNNQQNNANTNGNLLRNSPLTEGSSLSLPMRCNKRAVLCGVTYGKRKFSLKGSVNDVVNMKELLVNNFNFPISCMRILTEEVKKPSLIPTRQNILKALKWLVKDCQAGDSLVFYFSGHGLNISDSNGDEIDGFDEAICPVDFMTEGSIIDDELNSTIVWPLKKDVTLHAIVDAGHSGTILDLNYVYNKKSGMWDQGNYNTATNRKHTSGGVAICLSACEDDQMASASTTFGQNRTNGVLTYLFTKAIRDYPGITYRSLLNKMQSEIEKMNASTNRRKFTFQRKVAQDPLLSSSEKFDVSATIFTM
ncbi:hypothetical protein TanjilG_07975 [Lupinus angustifolius]|uniref:Peptidase C14 caspase domain-containing protein n=1 Tax=Lupinus angustifolius TaxID=3871 RepID=A0A4P1RM29_LUPAN|nr:PREDICTED: metacaspase-3-like [Lupinus angustifolius]OIW13633.1 hypothetical protein TanjilG_07975 [Lupinus angustifolius]